MTAPPPASRDYTGKCSTALANILANDTLGDCTCAGALHILEVITSQAGASVVFQASDAVALYSHWCGYVPGNPATDQGGDIPAILAMWCAGGIDGKGTHAIAGSLVVDPANQQEVMHAIDTFGVLYLGGELEDAWTQIASNGGTWADVGPQDPNDGHCIVAVGYDAVKGVMFDSWGFLMWMPWPSFAKFCAVVDGGDCFVILTKEWVSAATHESPDGIDFQQLVADFDYFGGTVPIPTA
jgi:hypothetical protein